MQRAEKIFSLRQFTFFFVCNRVYTKDNYMLDSIVTVERVDDWMYIMDLQLYGITSKNYRTQYQIEHILRKIEGGF